MGPWPVHGNAARTADVVLDDSMVSHNGYAADGCDDLVCVRVDDVWIKKGLMYSAGADLG